MTHNDISIRPAKHQITIGGSDVVYYGPATPDNPQNRVRRTQAFVLKSGSSPTVVWPGSFIELSLPSDIAPDSCLTVEPRSKVWPPPQITEAVSDKIRIFNDSDEPQLVKKHDHLCQVRYTTTPNFNPSDIQTSPQTSSKSTKTRPYSSTVSVDPDKILPESNRSNFNSLLNEYDEVFNPSISGYNGAVGKFEATINMGPVLPHSVRAGFFSILETN